MTRILFVCLGNICRSPAAEGVFRTIAARKGLDVTLDSAGTSGWHIGNPPYGPMQDAARLRGYDLSSLRARQFVPDDFGRFDLILGMDAANIRDMEAQRPGGADTRVQLFLDYADTGRSDVPDPYYTRNFNEALELIEAAAEGLARQLEI